MKSRVWYSFSIFLILFFVLYFFPMAAYANSAYWFDPLSGTKISSLSVTGGANIHLILKAEVPVDKTLKAYKFTVRYDHTLVSLLKAEKPVGSPFPPTNINTSTPGVIILNVFWVAVGFGLSNVFRHPPPQLNSAVRRHTWSFIRKLPNM